MLFVILDNAAVVSVKKWPIIRIVVKIEMLKVAPSSSWKSDDKTDYRLESIGTRMIS